MKEIIFNRHPHNRFKYLVILIVLVIIYAPTFHAQPFFDYETGIVGTGYNDVRIPGNSGTMFSLKDDLKPESRIFYRLRVGYTFKERHILSLLYAPLTIKSNGNLNKTVEFAGESFPANTPLNATYTFNSYRLTYRYDIIRKESVQFGLGFTAKIRDAEIALKNQQVTGRKTNVGFVPILNFRLYWLLTEKFGILLDGDALAAKQGRAEDVLLAATYKFLNIFTLKAGYRILEGGADNDEVYNFSMFNYGAVGLIISW